MVPVGVSTVRCSHRGTLWHVGLGGVASHVAAVGSGRVLALVAQGCALCVTGPAGLDGVPCSRHEIERLEIVG